MKYSKENYFECGLELRGMCNQERNIETFTFDGELFRGDAGTLIDQYMLSNPSKKFRTWLIDRNLRMEVGTSVFKINSKMLEALKWFITSMSDGSLQVFTDDSEHKAVHDDNQDHINEIEALVKELT